MSTDSLTHGFDTVTSVFIIQGQVQWLNNRMPSTRGQKDFRVIPKFLGAMMTRSTYFTKSFKIESSEYVFQGVYETSLYIYVQVEWVL